MTASKNVPQIQASNNTSALRLNGDSEYNRSTQSIDSIAVNEQLRAECQRSSLETIKLQFITEETISRSPVETIALQSLTKENCAPLSLSLSLSLSLEYLQRFRIQQEQTITLDSIFVD
jgi:hypothetical protein